MTHQMKYVVRKTLHYYPIRYFFQHLFFDTRLFFSNYTLYIFFIRSYKESSSEYSYIKIKNKKCILNEKN
jgi:hypothetical protein